MKRMEERDMKGKDLRQLYRKFNDEMERVELPSGDELRQLIGERGAEKKPSAPYIPLSRPKPVLRYAMAAMLVLALGVGVWMVERRQSGPSMAASRPEKPAAVADTAALPITDSIEPTAIDKPQVQLERLASTPMPETDKTRVQVAADSVAAPSVLETKAPEIQMIADADTAGEMQPLAEVRDTIVNDSATGSDPHSVRSYPDKPTQSEVEKIIKDENGRRALRSNRRRRMFKKREDYIDKQKDQREKIYIEAEQQLNPQMRMHFVPTGNGRQTILYY